MNYYLLVASIILCIILLILYSTKSFKEIDKSVKNFFIKRRTDIYTSFYIIITNLIIVGLIVFPLYFIIIKDYRKFMVVLLTLIIANITGNIIKIILKRERPVEKLVKEEDYSFPSMHTLNATMVYGGFLLFGVNYYILFIPLIILTGVSRMYLGVHYFTDIIGGLAFGLFFLSIIGVFL